MVKLALLATQGQLGLQVQRAQLDAMAVLVLLESLGPQDPQEELDPKG